MASGNFFLFTHCLSPKAFSNHEGHLFVGIFVVAFLSCVADCHCISKTGFHILAVSCSVFLRRQTFLYLTKMFSSCNCFSMMRASMTRHCSVLLGCCLTLNGCRQTCLPSLLDTWVFRCLINDILMKLISLKSIQDVTEAIFNRRTLCT